MSNPFRGHKILKYEVHIKGDTNWCFLFSGKTRRSAELYLKNVGMRGQFKFSRVRLIDGLNHREDLYEIAKT